MIFYFPTDWFNLGRMMKRFALPVILFLAACASSSAPHVSIRSDEFSKEIEVSGVAEYENPIATYNPHLWRLRTFINKDTHVAIYQAYLFVLYKGSRKNFKFAADDTATPLKVMPIENGECEGVNAEKCEALGILVSETQLRAHAATGYRIQVKAKNGAVIILTFTPEMIRLQLDAVDKLLHSPLGIVPSSQSQ